MPCNWLIDVEPYSADRFAIIGSNDRFAGNSAAAPSWSSNQYPSLVMIEAAYSNGTISAAQRQYYKLQTEMQAQVQIQAAKDVLRGSGDVDPS